MSRSFFRLKNDWTISVTNRDLLDQKRIDSRVFMTVLAIQGEIEDWQKKQQDDNQFKALNTNASRSQSDEHQTLIAQIKTLSVKEGLDKLEQPSHKSLEVLADELDLAFTKEMKSAGGLNQSNEERIRAFTSYCLKLVSSPDLSEAKKKSILTLLNFRLQGHN